MCQSNERSHDIPRSASIFDGSRRSLWNTSLYIRFRLFFLPDGTVWFVLKSLVPARYSHAVRLCQTKRSISVRTPVEIMWHSFDLVQRLVLRQSTWCRMNGHVSEVYLTGLTSTGNCRCTWQNQRREQNVSRRFLDFIASAREGNIHLAMHEHSTLPSLQPRLYGPDISFFVQAILKHSLMWAELFSWRE